MSSTTVALKPCPLCGGPGNVTDTLGFQPWHACADVDCDFYQVDCSFDTWNALPRREDAEKLVEALELSTTAHLSGFDESEIEENFDEWEASCRAAIKRNRAALTEYGSKQ